MGGLVGALALTGITIASAQSTGDLYIFSAAQTIPSGGTSGSVFLQAQNFDSPADVVNQTSALTIDLTTSSDTTTTPVVPATVTIPAGDFSISFTFTATNSSATAAGTFVLTATPAGGVSVYGAVTQTETVEPAIATPPATVVTPGFNGSLSASTPVAPGGTDTYFSISGTGITNNSSATVDYDVTILNGTFSSGGDGSVTGLGNECVAIAAGTTATVTDPVVVVNSPYRPAGTYPLEFVVVGYSSPGCTTPVGYYQGISTSVISNGAYTTLTPTRILDTRSGLGGASTVGPNSAISVAVTGSLGSPAVTIPATATAVALNVTVVDTTANSFLSVYPTGAVPGISSLNWAAGQTVPNLVIVQVGTSGQVSFYNNVGRTDVLADIQGYFSPEATGSTAGSFVPLTPSRICDTRPTSESGISDQCTGETLHAGATIPVTVSGNGGVPVAADVSAVVANVTVVNTSTDGFLSVYPGTTIPGVSNLNWRTGETVANRAIVKLSSGDLTVYNNVGTTDVIIDVDGYITTSAAAPSTETLFTPITPTRVLDTVTGGGTLGAGLTLTQQFSGNAALSPFGGAATAVAMNVTAVAGSKASYLTVYPSGATPNASDINWAAGATVPNFDLAALSSTGLVTAYNSVGTVNIIMDAFGYFTPTASTT
jgi:hypothetical protein